MIKSIKLDSAFQVIERIINDKVKKKDKKFISYSFNNYIYNDPLSNDMIELLNLSYNILSNRGYKVDRNFYNIDIHCYNLKNEKYETPLDWHVDDYGATNYKVNTMIFYLRKDKKLKKGNLIYSINNKIEKISVFSKTIIIMDGRILHKPEDLEGTGRRDSIVVQFKRIT